MKDILIVEDDITFALMLQTWLQKKGFRVETSSTCAQARKKLEAHSFHLVLSDLRLPDTDGIHLLSWMRGQRNESPFIIMTGYGDIQTAVEAMKCGAEDYIAKPVQPDLLLIKINEALRPKSTDKPFQKKETLENNNYLEGESEAARQLYRYVELVAPTPMSVLINGASGTGKEYVARRIHRLSSRAEKPFIAIDCGSISKELAASEFFGHVKGSFTGAVTDKTGAFVEANGGTIFLDEIGNLSYDIQVMLLRVLQERKVRPVGSGNEINIDVRLISATNENLEEAIIKGDFREDLYHRINEFTLRMPALKERGEDILLFANFFLDQANLELNRQLFGFDAQANTALLSYSWPGNLRQMRNIIRRVALLAQGDFITEQDLKNELAMSVTPSATTALHDTDREKQQILEALRQTDGNKSRAAQLLGIDRKTLYNKLKTYNLG